MTAATPTEWAEALSVALMLSGTTAGLFHLTVDADPVDFDPRPAVHRALDSGRLDPALIAVTTARHTTREVAGRARSLPRDTALTATALLMLLSAPEATR
ncbi:hypothetical protein ACFUN7_24530 [Streptomyces sp. NPDC057236]|uniref:hypothetical protein n=1 Tax=Streptomyces sp. NPDC057236 TaxID=3346059 RepID=UPI0036288DDC